MSDQSLKASLEAAGAEPVASSCEPLSDQLWEPGVWRDLPRPDAEPTSVEAEEGDAGEPSDGESGEEVFAGHMEVILEERPIGLEICPANAGGHGAIVSQSGSVAAALGVEPGSSILTINARCADEMPTEEIRTCLHEGPLPVALSVNSMLNLPRAKKMKTRTKDPVTVCTAHCRGSYRALQAAIQELGWREVAGESREASVVWLEHNDPTDGIAPVQTVSRLDAFLHMCRKAPLARCLNSWMEELPEEFTFVPETWVLPYDTAALETAMSRGRSTYIAKPSAGTQGKGIVLAKKWGDLNEILQKSQDLGAGTKRAEYVVQRYIAKPLLLDGLKFDMRIYVIVTSVVPLRAYLFKEGIARFCTVPYQAPKDGNLRDVCMHLTNYAVNKQSKDFQASDGNADEGSKRSVSSVFWQIEQSHAVTAAELWDRVAELSANTLMALRPGLLEHYVQHQDSVRPKFLHPLAPKGFQIIGFDVLLDSKLQPRLIELNANPSLSVMQPGRSCQQPPPNASIPTPTRNSPSPVAPDSAFSQESNDALAAGSGLQAVRMVSQTDVQQPNSTTIDIDERMTDDSLALGHSPSDRDQAILRIASKLQKLSLSDLLATEAFMDSCIPTSTSPSPPPTRGDGVLDPSPHAEVASSQFVLARQASSSPDVDGSERNGSERGRRSASTQAKKRLGISKPSSQDKPKESKMVTSPLDLAIKKELVTQAMLLAKPAPQSKVGRLRKQWFSSEEPESHEVVPLDDDGAWQGQDGPRDMRPEVRADAPERCPCLEALDFDALALPEVSEYARAHYALYRAWSRSLGPGQSTLGQAQTLKMLERRGLLGPDQLFPDRIAAQLWLTQAWRKVADGAFGLDLPQFVRLASRLGALLRGGEAGEASDEGAVLNVGSVLEFVRRGGAVVD